MYKNNSGCFTSDCGIYSAITQCHIVIRQGEDKCQVITLLDKNNEPLDLYRLSEIFVSLYHQLGCHVIDFSNKDSSDYKITILQEKECAGILHISPVNFDKLIEEGTFYQCVEVSSVSEPDTEYIQIGDNEKTGIMIYHCEYNSNIFCKIVPDNTNTGTLHVFVNGIEEPVSFGEPFELISPDDNPSSEITLTFLSADGFRFRNLELTTNGEVKNKGMFSICFPAVLSGKLPIGNLKAEIAITFNEYDLEEPGVRNIISCLNIAEVKRVVSPTIMDGLYDPLVLYTEQNQN